jgi:UDP-galactopyranose mutase
MYCTLAELLYAELKIKVKARCNFKQASGIVLNASSACDSFYCGVLASFFDYLIIHSI